jgi:hypothetical protein
MKHIAKIMLLIAVLLTLASCQRQTTQVYIQSVPMPFPVEVINSPDTIQIK